MKLIVLFIYVYAIRCRDVWICSCNAASHNVDISFSCASKRWFTKLVVKSECLCLSAEALAQYLKLDFSILLFDKFLYYNFIHFENKKHSFVKIILTSDVVKLSNCGLWNSLKNFKGVSLTLIITIPNMFSFLPLREYFWH